MREAVFSGESRCIFAIPGREDKMATPCSGPITKHHIHYRCEGGSDEDNNLVFCCRGHQKWLHNDGRSQWGDEDFGYLLQESDPEERQKIIRERHERKMALRISVPVDGYQFRREERNRGRQLVSHARMRP